MPIPQRINPPILLIPPLIEILREIIIKHRPHPIRHPRVHRIIRRIKISHQPENSTAKRIEIFLLERMDTNIQGLGVARRRDRSLPYLAENRDLGPGEESEVGFVDSPPFPFRLFEGTEPFVERLLEVVKGEEHVGDAGVQVHELCSVVLADQEIVVCCLLV